jgi:polysaccharide export outer membrane protein
MRPLGSIVRAAALGTCLLASACRHAGHFVWVDDYPGSSTAAQDPAYLLGPGDVLSIRVLNHDEMSGRVRVRSDGRISVPFLNDLEVAGRKPTALAEKLRADFKEFVNNPVVTVTLEEPRPFTISVTGEVVRPGVYPLEPSAGILQSLASAGGLSQFAHDDQIYVIRKEMGSGSTVRIRFRYEALAHAEGHGATFGLQRNDVVVVE